MWVPPDGRMQHRLCARLSCPLRPFSSRACIRVGVVGQRFSHCQEDIVAHKAQNRANRRARVKTVAGSECQTQTQTKMKQKRPIQTKETYQNKRDVSKETYPRSVRPINSECQTQTQTKMQTQAQTMAFAPSAGSPGCSVYDKRDISKQKRPIKTDLSTQSVSRVTWMQRI